MFKRMLLWFVHLIVPVETGFVYETRKGAKWYILTTDKTVCVFWRENHTGPHYRIPRTKWYQFVKDMHVKFIGFDKP